MLGDCWGTKDRVGHPEQLKRQEAEAPRAARGHRRFRTTLPLRARVSAATHGLCTPQASDQAL